MDENKTQGPERRESVGKEHTLLRRLMGALRGVPWPVWAAVGASVAVVVVAGQALRKTHARSRRHPCEALRVKWVEGDGQPISSKGRASASASLRGLKQLVQAPGGGVEAREFRWGEGVGSGPVLVNFWMTSCAPCLAELPSLLRLGARWESHGGSLVLVATDEEKSFLEGFFRRHPGLWPQGRRVFLLWDPGGRVARKMGTRRYPETHLLAPSGRAVFKVAADRDWESLAARRCLLRIVRERAFLAP